MEAMGEQSEIEGNEWKSWRCTDGLNHKEGSNKGGKKKRKEEVTRAERINKE